MFPIAFLIPLLFQEHDKRLEEQRRAKYKWWGEPRAGGVECWKPCTIHLKTGEDIKCPRFYDFCADEGFIYLCELSNDTGVWSRYNGEKSTKTTFQILP